MSTARTLASQPGHAVQYVNVRVAYPHRGIVTQSPHASEYKELTLKIGEHHTAAKAIDKVLKALRQRYPDTPYASVPATSYYLAVEGHPQARIPYETSQPLVECSAFPSSPDSTRFVMLRDDSTAAAAPTSASAEQSSAAAAAAGSAQPPPPPPPAATAASPAAASRGLVGFAGDTRGCDRFPPRRSDACVGPASPTSAAPARAVQTDAPRTLSASAQTDAGFSSASVHERTLRILDPARLSAELRMTRERGRAADPCSQAADAALRESLHLRAEYPRTATFGAGHVEDLFAPRLSAGIRSLADPVLAKLADAVDAERQDVAACVAALQRETQELRTGWLEEASKTERLLESVSRLAEDREALLSSQAAQGRVDAEYLVKTVRNKVATHVDLQSLATRVLEEQLRRCEARLLAVEGGTSFASEGGGDVGGGGGTPEHGRGGGAVEVVVPVEGGTAHAPLQVEELVDQQLLHRIAELEDENDALAQRVTLMETRSALLASGTGVTWLDAADEAKILTERVVQLEGELARERDLRMQYAVQGEVTKQISISEILRQKEQITLQHSMLASAGMDFHESTSPLRHHMNSP